ncbi:MAG: helix-turn-helix transcriptional regulator [Hungatella sp.]
MTWVVFEEVTAYIRQHYAKITIRDLATTFHFQEDYFNRLIKLRTGLTYSEYVQHIRLSQAEFLLKTTNQSIEQIADRVGYHNKGYFYKIFKEKYHMTPSRYRTF